MDPYAQHLGAIRRVAEHAVTVRDITVAKVWGPQPEDVVAGAVAWMIDADFDVAPVIESPIWRYVAREELASAPADTPVSEVAATISAADLVTSTLPLADAIELLGERDWFFVIEGHEISGILTVADLQSLTVGLVVLGFILATEAGIDALINRHLSDRWDALLTDERLAGIEAVFEDRRARNAEIDKMSCLNLDDRLTILCKSPELRSAVGISRNKLEQTARSLKRLRNSLAHGDSIIDVRDDPREGIRSAGQARAFAARVWDALVSDGERSGGPEAP